MAQESDCEEMLWRRVLWNDRKLSQSYFFFLNKNNFSHFLHEYTCMLHFNNMSPRVLRKNFFLLQIPSFQVLSCKSNRQKNLLYYNLHLNSFTKNAFVCARGFSNWWHFIVKEHTASSCLMIAYNCRWMFMNIH